MPAPANTQTFRHTWKDSAGDKWLITIDYAARAGRAVPVSLVIRGDGDKELTQRAVRELLPKTGVDLPWRAKTETVRSRDSDIGGEKRASPKRAPRCPTADI